MEDIMKLIKRIPINYWGPRTPVIYVNGIRIILPWYRVGEPLLMLPTLGRIEKTTEGLKLLLNEKTEYSTMIITAQKNFKFTSDTDFDEVCYEVIESDEDNTVAIVASAQRGSGAVLSLTSDNHEFTVVWA
jgi:hypothetical protein